MNKTFLSWIPALIFMGVIFCLSSIHGDKIHLPDFSYSDKVAHFFAYAFLGWLISLRQVLRGSARVGFGNAGGLDAMGQIVGMLYGASDEFHQMFVPLRDASVYDWNADALGIMAGSWVCRKMFRKVWNRDPLPEA